MRAKRLNTLSRAAERADALFAYEEAARYYRLALQALEASGAPEDATLHCRLLIALGEATTKAGESLQAAEILHQAAASAKAHGVALDLARAAVGVRGGDLAPGHARGRGRAPAAGRARRPGEEDGILRAQVLSSLTRALIFSGALDEGEACARTGGGHGARRIGDPATLAAGLRAVVSARWLPEQFAARFGHHARGRPGSPNRSETGSGCSRRRAGVCST